MAPTEGCTNAVMVHAISIRWDYSCVVLWTTKTLNLMLFNGPTPINAFPDMIPQKRLVQSFKNTRTPAAFVVPGTS